MVNGPVVGHAAGAPPVDEQRAEAAGGLVQDVLIRVAEDMERALDANSAEVKTMIEARFPEMRGDRHWADLLRSSIAGNVETLLHALRHGIPVGGLPPPPAATEFARRMAQHAVPVGVLARAYRMGLAQLQDEFLRRMTTVLADEGQDAGDAGEPGEGEGAGGVRDDPVTILTAVRYAIGVSHEYIESVTARLEEVYADERNAWGGTTDSARAAVVRRILAGDDRAGSSGELRYDLDQTHVAAVLWLPEDTPRDSAPALLERAVRALGELLGSTGPPLAVASDELSVWAWYPLEQIAGMLVDTVRVRDRWEANERAAAQRPAARRSATVALGAVGQAVAGFRRSHEQALHARAVSAMARRPEGSATAYEEPGLSAVAMLCTDLSATAEWVAETLGPLAGTDETAARTRATIRMFYLHGASHKAAAQAMHVHPNTVKYRIRRAEEVLGRPLQSNRGDIELAVSICYWLGPEVLQG